MARGKRGPVPEALTDRIEVVAGGELLGEVAVKKTEPIIYRCADCGFATDHPPFFQTHQRTSGHGTLEAANGKTEPAIAEQPELFKVPGIVRRWITMPVAPETLNQGRIALATFYQMVIDAEAAKKATAAQFNSELAGLNKQMRVIAEVLAKPTEEVEVECEWRIIDGNARGLFRLDTGECIEQAALTAEDRAEELDEANDMNEVPF